MADLTPHGAAKTFRAGEVPKIRKIAALLGFDRLHKTSPTFEKDAFAIGFLLQGQSAAVGTQTRVALDEVELAELQERCEARDFGIA